mmetsp:Transcript_19927/g.41772  ORF Transcript_19927/g.41772 Transcript_19927/m.41772 type:complete len:293 (+) Transcript_19927:1239-2117(+)
MRAELDWSQSWAGPAASAGSCGSDTGRCGAPVLAKRAQPCRTVGRRGPRLATRPRATPRSAKPRQSRTLSSSRRAVTTRSESSCADDGAKLVGKLFGLIPRSESSCAGPGPASTSVLLCAPTPCSTGGWHAGSAAHAPPRNGDPPPGSSPRTLPDVTPLRSSTEARLSAPVPTPPTTPAVPAAPALSPPAAAVLACPIFAATIKLTRLSAATLVSVAPCHTRPAAVRRVLPSGARSGSLKPSPVDPGAASSGGTGALARPSACAADPAAAASPSAASPAGPSSTAAELSLPL